MRCFIALGLEPAPGEALRDWLAQTRAECPELSVSPAGNLHITLAFLGELDPIAVEAASSAVLGAANRLQTADRWQLRWGGVGVFPSPARARVFWLGVDDTGGRLAAAHQALSDELRRLGLPLEERSFRPHLTLARMGKRGALRGRIGELVERMGTVPAVPTSWVRSLILYQSILGRPAAVHQPLREMTLG